MTVDIFCLSAYAEDTTRRGFCIEQIFDTIYPDVLPAKTDTVYVCASILFSKNESKKYTIRTDFIDPSGNKFYSTEPKEIEVKAYNHSKKINFVYGIRDFFFKSFGEYRAFLYVDDGKIAETTLRLFPRPPFN